MKKNDGLSLETITAQGLGIIDEKTGGVSPAIHPSTTFIRDNNYELMHPDFSYSRDQNATHIPAEQILCKLENAEDGLLFSSGMAAAMAVIQSLKPNDHIVAPKVMYWGLRHWMKKTCAHWDIFLDFFDSSDPESLKATVQKGKTKLIWMETPCNPTWDIIDIEKAADVAKSINAKLAVDSTIATPVLTQPLNHGADLVIHSATKYLNGHCDVIAGATLCAKKDEFWEKICEIRLHGGAVLGSLEAWLLQRSLRTLFLRVRKSSKSALKIAQHFDGHPKIKKVLYPGLTNHPGHDIAQKQMKGGFGGMLSLRVKGDAQTALDIVKKCEVFARATSLGGVESLIEHRYSIEGEDSPIPKDLLRLSIGIEAIEDLISDLEQALS